MNAPDDHWMRDMHPSLDAPPPIDREPPALTLGGWLFVIAAIAVVIVASCIGVLWLGGWR